MIVWHYTHRENVQSILRDGLLPGKATAVERVWFCNAPKRAWAVRHVADWHRWRLSDMACIRADVPREWLNRWRWGVYTTPRSISADRLRAMY